MRYWAKRRQSSTQTTRAWVSFINSLGKYRSSQLEEFSKTFYAPKDFSYDYFYFGEQRNANTAFVGAITSTETKDQSKQWNNCYTHPAEIAPRVCGWPWSVCCFLSNHIIVWFLQNDPIYCFAIELGFIISWRRALVSAQNVDC